MRHIFTRFICTALLSISGAWAGGVDLVYRLPTDNDALFRGENKAFFTYVDRTFEGALRIKRYGILTSLGL